MHVPPMGQASASRFDVPPLGLRTSPVRPRELDTRQGSRPELRATSGQKSKSEAIEEAGLTRRTATRYEGLAGPRDEDLQAAGKAAAEEYFAKARAEREPATPQ